jgi:YYY domain-containing protein
MADAVRWYLATALIGGAGLLPAALLFPTLYSRGVLYARPLALVLLSVAVWWVGWSGLIPYGALAVVLVVALLWAASILIAARRRDLLSALRNRTRLLLVGEVVFVAVFALVAVARAQAPNAAATEKPMDLAMLTAVHRADRLPAPDPWLSGSEVSYYHLGHVTVDAVGQLSANGPGVAFNLGMAMVAAAAAVAVFGLAVDVVSLGELRRRSTIWIAGGGAIFALLWVAPLAGERDILNIFVFDDSSQGLHEWWWWWDATRVFPGPITEFPAFSILLGDLHAHVLALPVSLVAIAIALAGFQGHSPLTWRSWLMHPERLLLVGSVFAALFMTNSWDVFTFGPLWFAAAVVAFVRVGWSWPFALFNGVRYLALPIGAALLLAAPFIANLESTSRSIELVSTEAADPGNWLLVWLVPLLPLALAALLLRARADWPAARLAAAAAALAVAAWAVLQLGSGHADALADRAWGWVVLAGLVALIGVAVGAVVRAEHDRDPARAAWIALAAAAAVIMLATELLNVRTETAGRFNTVFKLWYHLWTIVALAGAVALAMLVDRVDWRSLVVVRRWPAAIAAVAAIVYLGAFAYAPAMAISRSYEGQAVGLDSLAYLQHTDPGLAGAVDFARRDLDPNSDVLLQAVSEAYGPGGYLAAATGVPTVLNWPWHEIQWRGSTGVIDGRREAVAEIYSLGATPEVEAVAHRYGVTYVYVGREERAQFGDDVAQRFAAWDVAWQDPAAGAVIFRVPGTAEVVAAQ